MDSSLLAPLAGGSTQRPTEPAAAIALIVHNRAQLTLRTLVALAGCENGASFHTVLLDDGSSDATPAIAAGASGAFTAIREERQLGFAIGCDSAMSACDQPVVVFLREDLVPTAGWLAALLAPFADERLGAVRPRVLDLAGRDIEGESWPALAVRRSAYDEVGGIAGGASAGRALKATFVEALRAGGWRVEREPAALLLWVPEAASRAANPRAL
jgi:glycosyltransferase involved in cell wall biosynthesis